MLYNGKQVVAVQGSDIDPQTCKGLTSGDRVLVEINGERLFGHGDNPILADIPWTVESNDAPLGTRSQRRHQIVLSHPFHPTHLTLHYQNMRHQRGPAVFNETDPTISSTNDGQALPICVILQLVSHYMPADNARESYPNSFHPSFLLDPQSRRKVIVSIVKATGKLEAGGFRYTSKCRFSLRSGVRVSELNKIGEQDLDFLSTMSDDTVSRLGRELGWLSSIKHASTVLGTVATGTALKTATHNDQFLDSACNDYGFRV
jgi:hypothetical protein